MEEAVSDASMVERIRAAIELSAVAIEVVAVAIILVAIFLGTARFLLHMQRGVSNAYAQYKVRLGKALLLGLELLVAADIVRTVALAPTLQGVLVLGVLVLVRTILSWSLVVEIDGRWPWRVAAEAGGRETAPE